MSTQFFPLAGCLQTATEARAALAASVLHLFKSSFVPSPSNVLADYTAAEADFDGYLAATLTTWNAPILAPGSGYMVGSPLVQFAWEHDTDDVGNSIGGCYLVDSGGHLRMCVIFTESVPMTGPGCGIPLNLIELFPTGAG